MSRCVRSSIWISVYSGILGLDDSSSFCLFDGRLFGPLVFWQDSVGHLFERLLDTVGESVKRYFSLVKYILFSGRDLVTWLTRRDGCSRIYFVGIPNSMLIESDHSMFFGI